MELTLGIRARQRQYRHAPLLDGLPVALGAPRNLLTFMEFCTHMSDHSDEAEDVTVVPVRYFEPDSLPEMAVTGAFGGVNPKGQIACALYSEVRPLPERQELVIRNGRLEETRGSEPSLEIERRVFARIVMTPETARNVGEWLVGHADSLLQDDANAKEGE